MPETREGHFSVSVSNWTKKAQANADQVLRAVCIGLLNNVVVRSPVGNPDLWKGDKHGFIRPPKGYVGGRFRANWQVTVGEPSTQSVDAVDPSGQVSILAGQVTLNGVKCGPPIYIVNNLPYAIPLEYGHSSQAPQGMVRLAAIEFQQLVDEAVRGLP
jgi:hypothetical protein